MPRARRTVFELRLERATAELPEPLAYDEPFRTDLPDVVLDDPAPRALPAVGTGRRPLLRALVAGVAAVVLLALVLVMIGGLGGGGDDSAASVAFWALLLAGVMWRRRRAAARRPGNRGVRRR